jgi:hypothetical protein
MTTQSTLEAPYALPSPFSLPPQPGPSFGLTGSEQAIMADVPGLGGAPTVLSASPAAVQQSGIGMALAGITGGAVSSDPREWTPEEAAAQSDRALARIAQVNPELAQELQKSRTGEGSVETEDEGGFWNGLKNAVGTVLDVTGLDTVLELVGRTAHLVPEIVYDWGEESIWKNASDALMGRSDVSFDDVLVDKFGMERNFFTAALGFGLDVLADPLTYLTFGTGGIGRELTGKAVATASVESALRKGSVTIGGTTHNTSALLGDVMRQAQAQGIKNVDEAVAAQMLVNMPEAGRLADVGGSGLIARIKKTIGEAHPDAQGGLTYTLTEGIDRAILTDVLRMGDDAFRSATTVGWQRVTADAATKFGIDKRAVDDILRGRVRAGGLTFGDKYAYAQSKAAAAALGGFRIRASIPVLGLRLSTNRIPFLPSVMDFSVGRRFFAGLSGNVRLMKMMGRGAATPEDLRAFWQGGYKGLGASGGPEGLYHFNPGLAKQLAGGRFKHGGSIFYSFSEMLGKATAHLSPHWRVMRGGGLGAKYAADAARIGTHMERQLRDTMRAVQREDGSFVPTHEIDKMLLPIQKVEDITDIEGYAQLMPPEAQAKGAATYYDEQYIALRDGGADPDDLAALEQRKADAVELEQKLRTAGALDAAKVWSRIVKQAEDELSTSGIHPDYMDGGPAFYDEMGPADAQLHVADGQLAGKRLRPTREGGVPEFNEENMSFGEDGLGYEFDEVGNLDEGLPADGDFAARPMNLYDVDKTTGAGARRSSETIDRVLELRRQAERAYDEMGPAITGETQAVHDLRRRLTSAKRTATRQKNVADEAEVRAAKAEAVARRKNARPERAGEAAAAREEATKRTQSASASRMKRQQLEEQMARYDEVLTQVKTSDQAREGFAAQFITKELRKLGYDGVRTRTDDGVRVTIFRGDKGAVPAWRINPRAPRNLPGRQSVARGATDEAMAAINRSKVAGMPGGSAGWLRAEIRKTLHLNHRDAENALRRALSDVGVELREGQTVLDSDPLRVLDRHVDDVARQVRQVHEGRYARDLESLGFMRSPWQGDFTALDRYRLVASEGALKAMQKINEEAYEAGVRAELWSKRTIVADLAEEARKADEAIGSIHAEIDDELAAMADVLDKATVAGGDEFSEYAKTLRRSAKSLEAPQAPRHKPWQPGGPGRAWLDADRPLNAMFTDLGEFVTKSGRRVRIAYRKVSEGETMFEEEWVALDADELAKGANGAPVIALRNSGGVKGQPGSVAAVTQPKWQNERLGQELLRQHWKAEGVETLEDAKKQIKGQSLSPGARRINEKQAARVAEEMKRRASEAVTAAHAARDRAMLVETEALKEVNRVIARETIKEADNLAALVPAKNALNMTGMERLGFKGFEDVAMPSYMAEEFKRQMTLEGFSGAHKAFRRFNNLWKTLATWMYPGFHIRNVMGAFFNNWLGGVPFEAYVTTQRIMRAAKELGDTPAAKWRWASMKLSAKDAAFVKRLKAQGVTNLGGVPIDEATYADMAVYSGGMGITSSNGRAFAEAEMSVEKIRSRHGQPEWERVPVVRKYVQGAKWAGTATENLFRTAAFVHGLNTFGNPFDARVFTMMRHGDYHDLTDFEFKVVRDLIPFYKWMRTNLPYQMHQLLENPGKLLATQKAGEQAFTAFGRDYDEEAHKMPEWMRNTTMIPIGGDEGPFTALMLDLPMNDLHFSGREMASSWLPMVRPFIESFITEKSTFTGAPLEGAPVELSGAWGPLAPMLRAFGLAKPGPDGETFISDKTQNILGIMPVYSRFRNFLYADPERVEGRSATLISAIFGVSTRPVNEETLTDTELSFYYDQILPTLDWLRASGYPLPTTDDIGALGQTTDTVLNSLGITPGGPAAQAA